MLLSAIKGCERFFDDNEFIKPKPLLRAVSGKLANEKNILLIKNT